MFAYKYTKQFTYVSWSLVFFAHLYDFCVFRVFLYFEVVPIVLNFHNSALYNLVIMMEVGLYTFVWEYLLGLTTIYVLL